MKKTIVVAAAIVLLSMAGVAQATITVNRIGDDGWYAMDTRTPNGTNLVGFNDSLPLGSGTTADDTLIERQIKFVDNAAGRNAVELVFDAGTPGGKASIGKINTADGFATGAWYGGFYLTLGRLRATNTNTTVKLGIRTTAWDASQNTAYDVSIKYTADQAEIYGSWSDLTLSANGTLNTDLNKIGTWKISMENPSAALSSAYNAARANGTALSTSSNNTLQQLANNSFWNSLLFGSSSKVTAVVLEAGSFSLASDGYVDYIQSNILHNGEKVDFGAPVPEPSSIIALLSGLGSLMAFRRRKA